MTIHRLFFVTTVVISIAGCSGRIGTSVAQQCSQELSAAEAELNQAKTDGLGDAVSVSKAAGLITAAAVQKQFEKYEGCLEKAQRARAYVRDAVRN